MVSREGKWVKVRQEEEQHWKIRDTTYFDREAVIYRVDPASPAISHAVIPPRAVATRVHILPSRLARFGIVREHLL